MSAVTLADDVQTEIVLETLTVSALLTMAVEMGLTFPNKTRKAEIISGILVKREEIAAAEAKNNLEILEEGEKAQAEAESLDHISNEEFQGQDAPIGNSLAMFKDSPENVVIPTPLSSVNRKGTDLSVEEIRARIEKARKENEEAETLRKAAEASKPKYVAWEPTTDELVKRYQKIGYGVGLLIQATHRLEKELAVSEKVIEAMGESFDMDAVALAREAAIEGFAKCWDTYKFPSKAIRGMRGEAMTAGIWAEIQTAQPGLPIFAYLQDESLIPEVEEEGEEEEED